MTKKEVTTYSQQTFESIKHIDENGNEFWYAREMQSALEYAQWRRFQDSIERAKTACKDSGFNIEDHFADVGKMINLPKGTQREIPDTKLSRYACYLIVMNGDPRKEVIALGQTYFAVKTRQKEISDTMVQLSEDEKQLAIRDEVMIRNKFLASSARANEAHFAVGKKVRQTIAELGGTMPENLPTPKTSKGDRTAERLMKKVKEWVNVKDSAPFRISSKISLCDILECLKELYSRSLRMSSVSKRLLLS